MSARFRPTQQVRVRARPDDVGVVTKVYELGSEPTYDVYFDAQRRTTYAEHALLPVDDEGDASSPVDALRRWQLADAVDFQRFLTLERLTHPLASTVYSYLASKTELLPYQFKPILKLLDSPYARLLIADEVGLGKTIEAGIILTELNARQNVGRVLVVCPSALTEKWRREMLNRFDLEFEVVRGVQQLKESMRQAAERPGRPQYVISSLQTLRGAAALEVLEDAGIDFDIVIVDEAHHMRNPWTRSNALGDHLGSVADTMIFLTATPLNLGRQDFFELLRLLVPEEFEDYASFETQIEPNAHLNDALRAIRVVPQDLSSALHELAQIPKLVSRRIADDPRFADALSEVRAAESDGVQLSTAASVVLQKQLTELNTLSHIFTRTRKREVQSLFPLRRAWPVVVEFTDAEREFYDAVSAWVRLANERYGVGAGTFVLMNYQRQLASCMPATAKKLESTVLAGTLSYAPGEVDDVDIEEDGDESAREDVIELALDDLDDAGLRGRIRSAWARVRADGRDSKFDAFRTRLGELLESGETKVLVFSFFIGTINHLYDRLQAEGVDGKPIRVLKLYGPTPADDRDAVVRSFRDSEEPVVLLSSEVGSEGLDFQFCSSMFNYDLPWNPMRVEQRIGRLDRYGQQAEAIQILNLVVPDTIEGRIFYRLYDRINLFEETIGDLEAILSDEKLGADLTQLKRDVVFGRLSHAEEERRTDLIAHVIERKRQDLEEFDEESKRFVGHDEVFRERFNDIEAGHRYISPDEVRAFVEGFITSEFEGVRLTRVPDRDGVLRFRGRGVGEVYELMRAHLLDGGSAAKHEFSMAARLADEGTGMCTFDARIAAVDDEVQLISIHHPLIRAIAGALHKRGGLRPAGRIQVYCDADLGRGSRLAFFFRVVAEGLKREIDTLIVAVSPGGIVDETLTAALPALLPAAVPSHLALEGWLTEEVVAGAEKAARTWMQRAADTREDERRRYADAIVEAQLESLRLGHERRLHRVDLREQTARDERILRMLRGTRRNAERRYDRKRREIDRQREVSVGTELFATAVVELAGTPGGP